MGRGRGLDRRLDDVRREKGLVRLWDPGFLGEVLESRTLEL